MTGTGRSARGTEADQFARRRLGNVAGMEIREVAVIGLGTMGAGIAEVLARGGLRVTAIEIDPPALSRGMSILDGSLTRAVARGKLAGTEQARDLRPDQAGGQRGRRR